MLQDNINIFTEISNNVATLTVNHEMNMLSY